MLIDSHVHIGPWKGILGIEDLDLSLDETIKIEQKAEVSGALVFPSDRLSNFELIEEINKIQNKRNFNIWTALWYHPNSNEIFDNILISSNNIKAFKTHSSLDKVPINDKKYNFIYDSARSFNLPVVIHCGRWMEMSGWNLALEVAKKWKDVKFVFAHAGGNSAELRWNCVNAIYKEKVENVWLDLTGMGLFWITRKIINLLGAERFLFGSDFPLGHPKIHLTHLEITELSSRQYELITEKNFSNLFGQPSKLI